MQLDSSSVTYVIITVASLELLSAELIPDKTNDAFGNDATANGAKESIKTTKKHQNDINDTARNISDQNYRPGSALFFSMGMKYDENHSTRSNSTNNDAKQKERKTEITDNDAAGRRQWMQWTERNNLLNGHKTSGMAEMGDWTIDHDWTASRINFSQPHHINKRAIRSPFPACKDHVTRSFNSSSNMTEIMIAALLPEDDRRPFSIRKIQPAMLMAIEKMNPLLAQYNHTMVINFRDSKCDIADSINEAINFYVHREVDILFGPCCDYALAPVARQVKYWNLPLITAGGLAAEYGTEKRTVFSQITRVGPNFNTLIYFFRAVMKIHNWKHLKLLYNPDGQSDLSSRTCHIAVHDLHYGLLQSYEKFEEDSEVLNDLPGKIDLKHAVVVLCASADSVRDIMIKAHELNFDNGEYVFFNIDLFSSKNESKTPWKRENDTPERNEKARKAYEALMTVTLRKPTSPEYKNFSKEVKRRAKVQYKNFTYGEEEVNSFVGAFHDAVILYAHALNETLAANDSIRNGTAITRKMWNRTFRGITGNVSIDSNGDRNADYSLLDMDPETGEFEVVANYFGNTKQYEPVAGKVIQWAGGREHAPPDTPTCGFDNSKCPPEEPFPNYGIVIIVLGSLLVIVLVAAFFIYRHEKLKAELKEMNWRVKWEDIMLGTIEGERGERKMKKQAASNMSLARTEDSSLESHLLIERSRSSNFSSGNNWCKCGQCEETEPNHKVCCRHLIKLEDRLDSERCITSTRDFQDVVLNSQVLLTVYIHVMLVRKHRGSAPADLTPYKCRLMAARQFLCWVHTGEELKKETQWAVPACVIRAIKLMFPEIGAEMTSGDDACSLTLDDVLTVDNHTSV